MSVGRGSCSVTGVTLGWQWYVTAIRVQTFLARQVSPGSRVSFFRFPAAAVVGPVGEENVRSTSRIETSNSFPARARVVALEPLDETAIRGDDVFDSLPGSGEVDGCRVSKPEVRAEMTPLRDSARPA